MKNEIKLLDCTLRDGAYIVDARFGTSAIRGIIKKLQNANVDVIECGWLKDKDYETGTTFFHVPSDIEPCLKEKRQDLTYVVMIDWDRYDLENLPCCDGRSIDAIRVVFPKDKFREGIAVGESISKKGYKVFFQAANTLGYSDEELVELAELINEVQPVCLSIVDTFGAMYGEDLSRIVSVLDKSLDNRIKLGFHSHNNQQLSFALSMQFVDMMASAGRDCVADASLCGMGRGAGNTTTELLANYLNRKYHKNYDMNGIMDAIDMYMQPFIGNYQWGYSTPYFIAGMYCTHVNNIAYLLENHRTNAKDMKNIIEALPAEDRRKYDYDLLETKYLDYQNKIVDDEMSLARLRKEFAERRVLLLCPGRSLKSEMQQIKQYISQYRPLVIGINTISADYEYDYIFFSTKIRYQYAREVHQDLFDKYERIIASNIKTDAEDKELIVNYNMLIKRGWDHFDNSGIMCLRLMNRLNVRQIALAGFDGFGEGHSQSYADVGLPPIDPGKTWEALNDEIREMLKDFRATTAESMQIEFVTKSKYSEGCI